VTDAGCPRQYAWMSKKFGELDTRILASLSLVRR
jgi:hypothetical protein